MKECPSSKRVNHQQREAGSIKPKSSSSSFSDLLPHSSPNQLALLRTAQGNKQNRSNVTALAAAQDQYEREGSVDCEEFKLRRLACHFYFLRTCTLLMLLRSACPNSSCVHFEEIRGPFFLLGRIVDP